MISIVFAGCGDKCTPSESEDPCETGLPPDDSTKVYDENNDDFQMALENNALSGSIICFDVEEIKYEKPNFNNKDLTNTEFRGDVRGVHFFGANLKGASFWSTVENSVFSYANIQNTDFSRSTLINANIAFAKDADTADWPSDDKVTHSVWTGESSRSEPMLRETEVTQNIVDVIIQNTNSNDDGMMGPSWRSYLWDYHICEHGNSHCKFKSHIFDTVDQRYSPYTPYMRPDNGPTLMYMYNDYVDEDKDNVKCYIDNALDGLLASGGILDDPYMGRVGIHSELEICSGDMSDAKTWFNGLKNNKFHWNTSTHWPSSGVLADNRRNASEIALRPDSITSINPLLPVF